MELLNTLFDLLWLLTHLRFYLCVAAGVGLGFLIGHFGWEVDSTLPTGLGQLGAAFGAIWQWRADRTQA